MAAQFCKRGQLRWLHIQIGAACIRVYGFEGMRDSLDLLHTACSVFEPHRGFMLRQQLLPLGIFVTHLVQLGLQARLNKGTSSSFEAFIRRVLFGFCHGGLLLSHSKKQSIHPTALANPKASCHSQPPVLSGRLAVA